jgi:transposase
MSIKQLNRITDFADAFLLPSNATHRQYEALRAYFVDGLSSAEAAKRFGYTPGSFRVLCHEFRQNPKRPFFRETSRGPSKAPKKDRIRQMVIEHRKKNLSVYDIRELLEQSGRRISPAYVSRILKEEGFSKLPRRGDDERLHATRPEKADVADVNKLDLSERSFRTKFGGIFLFLPYLADMGLDRMLSRAGFPGSKMVPSSCAIRSLLALKLFGSARHSHVMSYVFDEGPALFAGLNVIPKRSFLTEYSCRIDPSCYPKLMSRWFDSINRRGFRRGDSFDVDFHTIPYHGDDALVEKHYVSKRSRRQKGILAFVAQDAGTRVFCYANGDIRKEDQKNEVLSFVDFWKQRTGSYPEEIIFDSQLTTQVNMSKLNELGIRFITLRRRSEKMLRSIHGEPKSAWRQIELENIARAYRRPRILDQKITLDGYDGQIRQIVVADLGHPEPTILLTNQMNRTPVKLVGRYAKRMIIENGIADGIDFFHMDALSSAVAMKINCDLQLTLMAGSLYRLLAQKIGNGYQRAKSRKIFRDFIDASAYIMIGPRDITVRFQKRAHNPLLLKAGFGKIDCRIPWLGNRRLCLVFG